MPHIVKAVLRRGEIYQEAKVSLFLSPGEDGAILPTGMLMCLFGTINTGLQSSVTSMCPHYCRAKNKIYSHSECYVE